MHKGRLEAFSDGVIAIIITIMVLELKVPHATELGDLFEEWPVFLSYVISFIYVGIYWNNHHHLMQAASHVNGKVLWANLFLLFWLSLFPFTTAWVGENHFARDPVIVYGFVFFMAAIAYYILVRTLIAADGSNSRLAAFIGNDFKGKASAVLYPIGIALAFVNPWFGMAVYALVGAWWLIPDRRIEDRVS
jgi:uncharacterized membrane protein